MIPINIPQLQDKELYQVLRQLSLLAVTLSDILSVGTTAELPTSGKRKFFYDTTTGQLMFYTGSEWKILG